jgi:hypothetical protein
LVLKTPGAATAALIIGRLVWNIFARHSGRKFIINILEVKSGGLRTRLAVAVLIFSASIVL